MRGPAVITLVAGGVLTALLVAGCTSSGGDSGGSSASSKSGAANLVNGGAGGGGDAPAAGSTSDYVAEDSLPASTNGANIAGSGTVIDSTTLVADTRALIRTAKMTVDVKNSAAVAVQADKADALVTKAGGETFGDSRTAATTGDDATATLTLKVPPAQLEPILTEMSQLGKEQSRSVSSQDVTTQVADVNARLASASASITRLRSLYSSATKVTDVIAIENELSAREADLESLQAQQRALSSETVMATVTLVLTTVSAPPVAKPRHNHYTGIGGAFANGWHHFVDAGSWLVTALTTVVPFAVLVALLIGAGLWLRRRRPTPTLAPAPVASVE